MSFFFSPIHHRRPKLRGASLPNQHYSRSDDTSHRQSVLPTLVAFFAEKRGVRRSFLGSQPSEFFPGFDKPAPSDPQIRRFKLRGAQRLEAHFAFSPEPLKSHPERAGVLLCSCREMFPLVPAHNSRRNILPAFSLVVI